MYPTTTPYQYPATTAPYQYPPTSYRPAGVVSEAQGTASPTTTLMIAGVAALAIFLAAGYMKAEAY